MPNYGIFGMSALNPACPLRLAPEGTGGVGTEWECNLYFCFTYRHKPSRTDFACVRISPAKMLGTLRPAEGNRIQ